MATTNVIPESLRRVVEERAAMYMAKTADLCDKLGIDPADPEWLEKCLRRIEEFEMDLADALNTTRNGGLSFLVPKIISDRDEWRHEVRKRDCGVRRTAKDIVI